MIRKSTTYDVGTIREWRGIKYKKVAPGKWQPVGSKKHQRKIERKNKFGEVDHKKVVELLENGVYELIDRIGREKGLYETLSPTEKAAVDYKKKTFYDGLERLEAIEKYKKDHISVEVSNFEATVKQDGEEIGNFKISLKDQKKNIKRVDNIVKEAKQGKKGSSAKVKTPPKSSNQKQVKKDFSDLNNVLSTGKNLNLNSKVAGKVILESGETGKSGFGLKHIIEQRFKKEGKTEEEITALIHLILEAVRDGEKTRENGRTLELSKNGIVAILRKEPNDKGFQWVLTGFDNTDSEEIKKEAADVISTVIANNNYTPEFSSFRKQVGAVIASLNKNTTESQNVNVKKSFSSLIKKKLEKSFKIEKSFSEHIADILYGEYA